MSGKLIPRLGVLLSTLAISLGAQSTTADARLETVDYPAEFRFLTHVPPNAIRTPVMFVSGDGILDEFLRSVQSTALTTTDNRGPHSRALRHVRSSLSVAGIARHRGSIPHSPRSRSRRRKTHGSLPTIRGWRFRAYLRKFYRPRKPFKDRSLEFGYPAPGYPSPSRPGRRPGSRVVRRRWSCSHTFGATPLLGTATPNRIDNSTSSAKGTDR